MGGRKRLIALALLGWALSAPAAGVYKWVDEQGRVHYGERPPTGTEGRQLSLEKDPSPPPGPTEEQRRQKQQKLLDAWEEERALKQERQQKARAEAEEHRRRCLSARDTLRSYREAGTLYDLDAQGRRRILSDQERAAAEQEVRQAIKRWCGE